MAEMASGSAFLQANPYAPAPEPKPSALDGVEAAAPPQPAPSTDPVVASWKSDPAFLELTPERQTKIATNYFQKNLADAEFQQLPPDRQAKIIQNFISVNMGDTGYVRAPVNPVPRAPVAAPTPKINAREVGFTPEQSAMFGPAARDKQDIEEAGRSAAASPTIMGATADVGRQEAAKQKANAESLTETPKTFGPDYSVTEGPAGQIAPEYDEEGKRSVLRDAYHVANMGKMLVEDAMAGLAGAGFGRESATAKFYQDIASKTAGQTGIDPRTNVGGIGVLGTMRGTAQMAGDMALLIPSGMAVSAAAQPAFSLLRPAAMASVEGQLAGRALHGAATGALYSLPQDPQTAWENIKLFAAFEAAAAGAHTLGQYGGNEINALTRHIVKTTGVPEKVYFSPTKVRDIMGASSEARGGLGPEDYALFQDMKNYGLTNADIIKATREGLSIELPTEVALRIADRPYFAKFKEAFGVEPYSRTLESEMTDPSWQVGQGGSMKPTPPKDASLDLMSPVPGSPKALPGPDMQPSGSTGPQPNAPVMPGEGAPNGQQVQEVLAPEGNGRPGEAGAEVQPVGRPGDGSILGGGVPEQGPIVAGPGPQQPVVQQGQPAPVETVGQAPGPEGRVQAPVGPAVGRPEGADRVDAPVQAGGAQPAGSESAAGGDVVPGPPDGAVRGKRKHVAAISGVKGEKFPVHYELRELGDLKASHNPLEQFRDNPDYPAGVQDRPYATDQTHQDQVHARVAKFDPSHLVNTGPTAETGPSVITRDGYVLGGNSRKMVLDILADKHPDRYQQYIDAMKEDAAAFGLNPEDVGRFKHPVLVRALDFNLGEKDARELGRISGVLNKPAMTGQDKISKGVAAAKGLSKKTISEFASGLSGYDTLRGYLDSPHASQKLVPGLETDGVLDLQNRAQYLVDGKLTPDGKDTIEAAVRGYVVPDNDLLQRFRRANADELKTFDFALPHLAYAKAMGENWVSQTMSDVIKLFLDYNAQKQAWMNKNKGAARKYEPDFYLKQPSMMPDVMDLRGNKTVTEQFRALVTFTPREFAAAWKGYAEALRELTSRPTMPGIEIDRTGLQKIIDSVMSDYDKTQERAPRSYKEAMGQVEDSVSEKPESETQEPKVSVGETQVKEKDVPLPKEEEPVLDLTEEDLREPWEMTLREFAGPKPSPPQIVGGKEVKSGDLKAWNAKKAEYDDAVAQAYTDGKLTLDEVRVKTPDQWLKLKGKAEVKPPVAPAKDPGVVKPAAEPQKPKPVVSKTLKDAGLVVTEKVSQKTGKPYWEISGKTYDNKDAIKALPGVKFGGKVWRAFDGDPTAALAAAVEQANSARDAKYEDFKGKLNPKPEAEPTKVGGRGLAGEGIGIQIKALRQKLDLFPSIAPEYPQNLVGKQTRSLIQKGEGAIPQDVLDAQVADIGKIKSAFETGKNAFVLASDPGMGKTFVIAGALKEIARNHVGPLVWVTQNRRLIEQIKADIEPFGLNDRLQFITYTDMSQIHAGKKVSDIKIDGAVIAWDEGHSVKNTSDAGEESGAARADLGQKYMKSAKFNIMASATPFENPTQMGYIAASGVFDQLEGMTGLGRAISGTPFSDFALAFGAGQRKIRIKGGREKQILEWERGQTPAERQKQNENAMAARQWLEKQGMLAQREMKLEPGMVTTELKSVPPTDANVALADNFSEAMMRAIEDAGADRTLRRNLAGYMTNTLKRIMEDAKVDAAVAEAKDVIAQGKQAVIFVETRAKKEISGKDYPGMAEVMRDWAAEQSAMGGDAGKPPYSRFQMAVAQALHEAGLDESLESTVARIVNGVGADKTAIFTGDRTENAANADLDQWLDNKKPLLVATMAKGGTGLSLHSRRPGDPERVLIGLNMPWTATVMKQVLGRVTRLGMLKPSEVRWLFLDHDFERTIAAKVGGRMQDMGAVVSGKIPSMGTDIEAFDFDAPAEGVVIEDIMGGYEAPSAPAERKPEVPTVQSALESPEALADLARSGASVSGPERVALARAMAEGVAYGRDGYDMEASPYGGLVYFQDVPGGRVAFHEVDGKLEFEHQLQFSKTSRAKVVTDPRLIKRILSKDILNQNPARTVVSELFQNSIDSLIDAKWPKDAHVEVALDIRSTEDKTFKVGIKDNGIGMTAKDVKTKFLAIGAKGKGGTDNVGGYGMAKVAFLFYPENVFVRTTKGGKTTEITATRDELMDGDFPVITRDALDGERGTMFVATMPTGVSEEGIYYDDASTFESAMLTYAKGLRTKNLKVTAHGINDYSEKGSSDYGYNDWMPADENGEKMFARVKEYQSTLLSDMPKVTPSVEIVDGENRATVHFVKSDLPARKMFGGQFIIHAQVYSKGMPLPALKQDQYDYINGIGIPGADIKPDFSVAIDFTKTHEPEHGQYPFLKNRTVVMSGVGDKIAKVIKDYVEKLNKNATDERVAEFREMIAKAPVMGGTPVLIPKASYPDVEGAREVVENHEKFFASYGKLLSTWKAMIDSANLGANTKLMITLDNTVYGWHAPSGLTGEGKIIAINPLTMMTKGEWNNKPLIQTDEYKALVESGESRERILGSASVHTLLHENVHNRESNHSDSFTSELARQSMLLGHLRLATMEAKATKFYKEFADEIESIAGDLDRVREGGDAASGGPGPDVDASRVPPRGVEPAGGRTGAAEGPVAVGGRNVLGEAGLQESRREVGEKRLTLLHGGRMGIFKKMPTFDEFVTMAERGTVHKATGKDLPFEGSAKTPISLGIINGYSNDDIAAFYVKRSNPVKLSKLGLKVAYEDFVADHATELGAQKKRFFVDASDLGDYFPTRKQAETYADSIQNQWPSVARPMITDRMPYLEPKKQGLRTVAADDMRFYETPDGKWIDGPFNTPSTDLIPGSAEWEAKYPADGEPMTEDEMRQSLLETGMDDAEIVERTSYITQRPSSSMGRTEAGKKGTLTVADVQAEVDKIAKAKFPHTMVEVVPTWIDLPAEISMGIQRAMDTSQVEALYDPQTKKMYILADRMLRREDVALAVLDGAMHENLHRGVDAWRRDIANSMGGSFKLANERIDGILNKAYEANRDDVRELANGDYRGMFDLETRHGRARATEEWFARQANQKGSWYDRFVAAVRDFLRKVMEKFGHTLKWTDAETRAFINRAHRMSKRFERADRRVNEALNREHRETLRERVQRTRPDMAGNLGQVQFSIFKNPLKGMTEGERTFALQVHELYDRAMLDVNVNLKNLQKKVQDLAGVSHDSVKARRLDMAMLIYRDLKNSDAAHVKNPMPAADRIRDFKAWAATELRKRSGDRKLRLQEFLRDLEQAQNLTPAQRDFVDKDMEAAFRITTLEFQRLGKLKGQPIKDYVFRKLTPPDDRPVESSGAPSASGSPVRSFSSGLMRRKYPTLLDAMQDGYELAPEVRGITNSWKEITTDAVKIASTTRFLEDGMAVGVLSTKNPGDWLPLRSPALKVWRPTASVKTVIRDNPGLNDTLAAKNDVIGNYSRRLFVTQPEVTWAVFAGQGKRAAAVFDNEADARLYADQLTDARVEYRENLNVFEKVPFYAPPAIANAINLMTASQAGKFFSKPLGKSLTYLNGTLKPWMLLGDFFHHQSLMRSWTFGGPHDILGSLVYGSAVLDAKGRPTAVAEKAAAKRIVGMLRGVKNSVSWRKAILSGLELIEERNPVIQKLVGKGMTFPTMADMTGHNMTKAMGIFETLIRAMGSQKAADAVAVGKILRSRSEHFLFATIDAGFKAQWGYTYFMHQLRHEIARGRTPDVDKIAEIVADAANTAFGGQHLGRAGRDPDLTKFLHLIMLAPDWAITQLKPAFAAIPGMDKVIAKVLGEMPPPPGRDSFYRVFLAKQLLAAAAATLLAQVLINGDSEEGPFQMYREQMSDLPTAARLRWAMVDVTRLYRKVNQMRESMGLEPIDIDPGTRYMFNLPGFMIAPLRLFELGRFLSAKGSPLVRVITPYISGQDWRDRPYKSVSDLKKSVQHPDRKSSLSLVKGTRDENPRDISQFPAIFMANIRDAQPLQVGQMLRWLQGEEDGLTATIKSLGVDFTVARDPRTNYKQFMEISKLSGEEFKEIKRSIYRKDYDPNKLPENDVEAYAAVSLKAAIHKTRVTTAKIREAIEETKANPDYTNEARRRRVEMLKKTEDQMYRNVVLYHKAYTEGMKRHTITVTPQQVEQLKKDLEAE